MSRIYILAAMASIAFMGWQDYRGNSMFGRKPDGAGWFSSTGPRRGPDGRILGGYHTYNHK